MVSLAVPSYVDLIPDNFKVERDPTQTDALSKYELDPVLLTAYLLDIVNSTYPLFQSATISNFKRTRRFKDILFDEDLPISNPEVFKGYLLFKGTVNDLTYIARDLGFDLTVTDAITSGLIDVSVDNPYFVNVVTDAGSWQFTNPTNTVLYGQSLIDQDMSGACGFNISMNYTVNTIFNNNTLLSLSKLLVNRLSICARLNLITINYTITEQFPELDETMLPTLDFTATELMSSGFEFQNVGTNPYYFDGTNTFEAELFTEYASANSNVLVGSIINFANTNQFVDSSTILVDSSPLTVDYSVIDVDSTDSIA